MKESIKVEINEINERKEQGYYNIAENRLKIFECDGYKCNK
ncbi:hypothetical protein UT300007_31010 [Clostridium sp. CTA-7]